MSDASDSLDSDVQQVETVTADTARDPNRAQRVVVAFNAYEKDGVKFYCPNRVLALDNACEGRSSDSSVVCRAAQDSKGKDKRMKRIKWVARAPAVEGLNPPEFTVRFAKGIEPCTDPKSQSKAGGGTTGTSWSGSTVARSRQICVLKSARELAVVKGRDAQFKYDIVMAKANKYCGEAAVLDPYFIAYD